MSPCFRTFGSRPVIVVLSHPNLDSTHDSRFSRWFGSKTQDREAFDSLIWFLYLLEDHTMFYNNVCYFMTYHVHECIRKYITSMLALCYRIQHVHLTITCITIKWVSQYVTICISRSRNWENARGCTTEEGMTQWKVKNFTKTHCFPSSNCLWAQSTTNREGGDWHNNNSSTP